MSNSSAPRANGLLARATKVIGFTKRYNFVLFAICSSIMILFVYAHYHFIDFDGAYCPPPGTTAHRAAPGECWSYAVNPIYKLGIQVHLTSVIPASFLAVLQFIPILRRKAMILHRLNGYLVVLLSFIGAVSGIMLSPAAFGGSVETQAISWTVGILFIVSSTLAMINVRQLQLEEHRAWMLRAWFYAGCIVTARPLIVASAFYISRPGVGPYYHSAPCAKLVQFFDNATDLTQKYPICHDPTAYVAVKGAFDGTQGLGDMAALNVVFGTALWVAFAIHAFGIEIYLHLTPGEAERLRNVSYARQRAAGFKNPGSAGLTSDRFGDAPAWVPKSKSKAT